MKGGKLKGWQKVGKNGTVGSLGQSPIKSEEATIQATQTSTMSYVSHSPPLQATKKRLAEDDLPNTQAKKVKFVDQELARMENAQKEAFRMAHDIGTIRENWTGLALVKENESLKARLTESLASVEYWKKRAHAADALVSKVACIANAHHAATNEVIGLTSSGEPLSGINAEMSIMIDDDTAPPAAPPAAAPPTTVEEDDADFPDSASACTSFTATTQAYRAVKVNKRVQGDFDAWQALAEKGDTKALVADLVNWLTARNCNPFSSLEQAHAFRTKYHTSDGTKSYYNNEQVLNEYFSKHYGKGAKAMAKHKGTLTTVKNSLIKRMGRARAQSESYLSQAASQ